MYQEVFKLHSSLLKAMAHPKRLEIIQLLQNQRMTVTEIQKMLGMEQANLSQHLQILRERKVVQTRRDGKQIYYRVADKRFLQANDLIREILIERYENEDLVSELTRKMKDLVPLVIDPVCKMRLSPKTASMAIKYKNRDYYFCASGCLKQFKKKPEKYAAN